MTPGTTMAELVYVQNDEAAVSHCFGFEHSMTRMGPFGLTLPELPPIPQGNLKV